VVAFAGPLRYPEQDGEPAFKTNIERLGWMFCDGRELERIRFPELFAVLGYLYGGSDNTFKIPDYRGYFLRGVDGKAGNDPDAAQRKIPDGGKGGAPTGVGSNQDFALQKHEHVYKSAPAPATPSNSGTAAGAPPGQPTLTEQGPTDQLIPTGKVKVSEKETRPKNIYVNYIIKFRY
jgi:microcystin-dependent protein